MKLKDYLIKNITEYDTAMGLIKEKLQKQNLDKNKKEYFLRTFEKFRINRDVYTKILSDLENKIIN